MEKVEKERKKRLGSDFYVRVIEKMGNDIVTTKQLYQIVDEVEKEQGIEHEVNRRNNTAKKIKELLGDSIVIEDDPTVKARGPLKPKTYLVSEDWREKLSSQKHKPQKPRAEKAPKAKVKVSSEKTKQWMGCIYSMLILANNNSQEFKLEDLREGLKMSINGTTLANWEQKAKDLGIDLEIKPATFGRRSKSFRISGNINAAFATLNEAHKKQFGESLPNIGFHLGMKVGKNIQFKGQRPAETVETKTVEANPLIYYIAALIRHERKSLAVIDIAKTLSKNGATYFSEDILNAIKPAQTYFKLTNQKDYVSLDGESAWLAIQDKFDPKKFVKYEVIARIGLPQKSMKKFGVNSEMVSEISENDNIYRIIVSYSEREFLNVVKLIDFIELQQEIGRPDKILNNIPSLIKDVRERRGEIKASYAKDSTYFLLECEE